MWTLFLLSRSWGKVRAGIGRLRERGDLGVGPGDHFLADGAGDDVLLPEHLRLHFEDGPRPRGPGGGRRLRLRHHPSQRHRVRPLAPPNSDASTTRTTPGGGTGCVATPPRPAATYEPTNCLIVCLQSLLLQLFEIFWTDTGFFKHKNYEGLILLPVRVQWRRGGGVGDEPNVGCWSQVAQGVENSGNRQLLLFLRLVGKLVFVQEKVPKWWFGRKNEELHNRRKSLVALIAPARHGNHSLWTLG